MNLLDTDPETAFRQLAEVSADSASPDFFRRICAWLGEVLQADHVVIAQKGSDSRMAHTIAFWSGGELQDNLIYELAGTPCETILNSRGVASYPSGLQEAFPKSHRTREMGIESYLGAPMLAPDREPIGHLAVLWNQPTDSPGLARELVRIASAQAGTELGRRRAAGEVNESERRLHTLMNHLPGMAYQCRDDDVWTPEFVSGGTQALTGYPVSDFTERRRINLADLYHPDDFPWVADEVARCVTAREPFALIYRMVRADGEIRWVWERGQAVEDDQGNVLRLEGFITDVTEQQQSERVQKAVLQIAKAVTARSGRDFFTQLVNHLTLALEADAGFIATCPGPGKCDWLEMKAVITDGRNRENYGFAVSGLPVEQVLQEGVYIVNEGANALFPCHEQSRETDRAQGYVGWRLDDSNGKPIGVVVIMSRQPLLDTQLALSVLQIFGAGAAGEMERQATEARIRRLAFEDTVTGIPNRVSFMQELEDWAAPGANLGNGLLCILLDLRRFMEINDTRGFNFGDEVLQAVASRCQQQLTGNDFVARLGADEFVLLLSHVAPDAVRQVVGRLFRVMSDPLAIGEDSVSIETSMGASHFPGDASTTQDLFRHASIALHHAKRGQTGFSVFDRNMADDMFRRQAMHARFCQALENDELQLHYQPQFDLASGKLTGAEALCRWHDAEWGWVSPGEFIPLAEERGTIVELGEWVLRTASLQLRQWQDRGIHFPGRLSINVSARQLDDPNLVTRIVEKSSAVAPEKLGLELTESGFMHDPDQAVRITHALTDAGFELSIDDFGTGYSSLSYLRRFAADTLKIDMSFVRDMLNNNHDRAIVDTIIAMARTLGMQTIAEGVETLDHANALLALGCDQAQGYYYGRPVSPDEFASAWLEPRQKSANE